MAVETYARVIDFATHLSSTLKKAEEKPPEKETEREDICEDLGLIAQGRVVESASNNYTAFTDEEWWVWQQFLPTRYSLASETWKNYSFDVIPIKALLEIKRAVRSKYFTEIEIRTPEKQVVDPLAIGIRDQKIFPIVRWGESLLPFKEIEKFVSDKYLRWANHNGTVLNDQAKNKIRFDILQNRSSAHIGDEFFIHRHCGVRMVRYFPSLDKGHLALCPRCGHTKHLIQY